MVLRTEMKGAEGPEMGDLQVSEDPLLPKPESKTGCHRL